MYVLRKFTTRVFDTKSIDVLLRTCSPRLKSQAFHRSGLDRQNGDLCDSFLDKCACSLNDGHLHNTVISFYWSVDSAERPSQGGNVVLLEQHDVARLKISLRSAPLSTLLQQWEVSDAPLLPKGLLHVANTLPAAKTIDVQMRQVGLVSRSVGLGQRKWPGVSTSKSLEFSVMGQSGLEFTMVDIWQKRVRSSWNERTAF